MTPISKAIEDMKQKIVISDNREQSKVQFPLVESVFAIILAWVGGHNSALAAGDYMEDNIEALTRIIPGLSPKPMSHDTILRLLKTVKFSELQEFLVEFCNKVQKYASIGEDDFRVLAMDGQTPRSIVYDKKEGQKSPQDRRTYNHQYYVTLYDSTNKMTILQDECQDKENENKACIRLCQMMSLEGSVVTSDALNCTRAVAKAIIENGGDYCLAVKGNKGKLEDAIKEAFNNSNILDEYGITATTEIEQGHGRIEIRYVTALPTSIFKKASLGEWAKDAQSIFFARTHSYNKKYDSYRETQERYFISSLSYDDPKIAEYGLRVIREHWGCENSQHHILDVTYGQDMMFAKNRNFIRNALCLNKIALNSAQNAKKIISYCKDKSIKRIVQSASRSPYKGAKYLCSFITTDTFNF